MEDRLLLILKHYNYTSSSFADKLGVQRSSISHLLSGRNKPGFEFLSRLITEFPDLNIDWVISGKGNMIKRTPAPPFNLSLFDNLKPPQENPEIPIENEKTELNIPTPDDVTDVNNANDTNVHSVIFTSKNRVTKVILFFGDKTWEEFLPSES